MNERRHLRHTFDHHPTNNAYQRFNKAVAIWVTNAVGTMTCAYIFTLLALVSLPAVLKSIQVVPDHFFPSWLVTSGLIALVAWIAQTFLQLVLLSIILVGQNVSQAADDARATQTFNDVESLLDLLNIETPGGLSVLLEAINSQSKRSSTPSKSSPKSRTRTPRTKAPTTSPSARTS